jgi:zinc/manganese transport system substrate-binding protein
MRRLAAASSWALLTAGVLTTCSADGEARPLVVVTTNILGDVVRELVGDQADVVTLMPAGSDPHSFQVSAQQAARMREADLLVANGLGLEEGVTRHVDAARDDGVPVVEAGRFVETRRWTADNETGVDPHFWTDPAQMLAVLDGLAEAMRVEVDALDADQLATAVDEYRAEIADLDTWMTRQLDLVPHGQRNLVTNHHVFGYLAERFGFTVIGAVVPSGSTLASPSPSDLAELAAAVREAGVRTVFADASQPDRLVQVLAEQAGLDVTVVPLFTESLTPQGGGAETYLQMMRANTNAIVTGLRPTGT